MFGDFCSFWKWRGFAVEKRGIKVVYLRFRKLQSVKIYDLDQHLAGHVPRDISSGPDSDPNKNTVQRNRSLTASKIDKAKGKGFHLNLNLSL